MKPVLMLAPIHGITDSVYRDAFASCFGGFDSTISPFITLRQGKSLRPGELQQAAGQYTHGMKVIPQVLTNHPVPFCAALQELHALGHGEVNWNLGCPYPMVAGRTRGAGLLPHPDKIDSILGTVLKDSPVHLSVKMRLGYHDPDEFKSIIEVLNQHPLSQVILHARTADQLYSGPVDVERAREALTSCKHPFVYNGEITSQDYLDTLRTLMPGTAAWMIGRGALMNPFLPSLLKGATQPSKDACRGKLSEFHDLLMKGYRQWLSGPQHLHDKMLAQWEYLAHSFADPHGIFTRIRRSDPPRYEAVAAWALTQPLANRTYT